MIHKAERYDIRGKDTIGVIAKYYINDLSFYNYLFKGFGYGIGYLLENLVYLELQKNGYQVIEREYVSLEAIDDNYEKVVVSMDDICLPSKEGIKHIQVWNLSDFLE